MKHNFSDFLCCEAQFFMLPNYNGYPAGLIQSLESLLISEAILINLTLPKCSISFRLRTVFGTSVPEAPVYEDCNSCRTENDVGATIKVSERSTVHSITKT